MSLALAGAGLLLGLAGAPHCLAMCGVACGGFARGNAGASRMATFQAGRLLGYSLAGAAAAVTVESFAWLSVHTAALQPVWTLFHLGVLAWGLSLLLLARQPACVERAGRAVWQRLRPLAGTRPGPFAAGVVWTFMPCGLLWSALLLASLSGGAWQGALTMALFAVGGGVALAAAPRLFAALRGLGHGIGARASGLLFVAAGGWALWMDMAARISAWCGLG